MKNTILAIGLSALTLFFWGFFSWVVLPWHQNAANKFTDEAAVSEVLRQHAPTDGIYYLPFDETAKKPPGQVGVFANILLDGYSENMGISMAIDIIGQCLVAFLILLLLRSTSGLDYWQRVRFCALMGLLIGFVSNFAMWNWFQYPLPYVLFIVIDDIIALTLAGLILSKFGMPDSDS